MIGLKATDSNEMQIANAFVAARRSARSLITYPAAAPTSLADAYAVQDAAIRSWPAPIVGWKVGRITGETATRLGVDRLSGPVFDGMVHAVSADGVDMPVFEGGFAAVEGEVLLVLNADAPADKHDWTTDEAAAMIGSARAAIEIASSPFPGINDHGPLVTISDFGNNNGVIVGEELTNWREWPLDAWVCSTRINGEIVGEATPSGIPGGPVESLRFLLENTARRGVPLKKGAVVVSGAVTGVHVAHAGDSAEVQFAGVPALTCRLVAATPA